MRYFLFTFCFLTGCIYGPPAEHKSPLNYLNGENYEASQVGVEGAVIPIAKRKERATTITGQVLDRTSRAPVRLQSVELFDDKGKSVAVTKSDNDGRFSFTGSFANGYYEIHADSARQTGRATIEVKEYNVDNVLVEAGGR